MIENSNVREPSADINEDLVDSETLQAATQTPFTKRLHDTIRTLVVDELPEKGSRIKRAGALVVGLATQVLDRGRAMVFVLPTTFDEVLTHGAEKGWNGYQTGTAAGVAVGGIFGAWGYIVGRSFQASLDAFPATTEKVTENHPVMVNVIGRAIDGFPKQSELSDIDIDTQDNSYDVGPYDTRKTIPGKVGLAFTRSLKTAFLYGTTAHVGVAKVSGHSSESISRRRQVVTAESAVALGGIAAAVSSMVTHDFLGAAEQVKDVITNKSILAGATAFFIGSATISNLSARNKYTKLSEDRQIA